MGLLDMAKDALKGGGGAQNPMMEAAMQLEYYYGAIHANCIDCHRAGQAGPVKCAECHPKQGG